MTIEPHCVSVYITVVHVLVVYHWHRRPEGATKWSSDGGGRGTENRSITPVYG